MPYSDPEKQKAAQREWYQKNKAKQHERNTFTKRSMATFLQEEKSKPCVDCGVSYPYYVMQFDHIGSDKVAGVGVLARTASIERVKAEIAKCELVCANCHAERTWQRLQHVPVGQLVSPVDS